MRAAAEPPLPGGKVTIEAGSGVNVFGRGDDGALWWRQQTSDGWSAWQSFGGNIVGEPAAVVSGSGLVHVFVRGADDQLWWRGYDGVRWTGWNAAGGVLSSPPVAAADGDGLVVAVRGGDSALHFQRLSGGTWSGWRGGGGVLASPPAVSSSGGSVKVVARGGDNGIWTQRIVGGVPTGWTGLGGITFHTPGVIANGDGTWVFVRGGDAALYWQRFDGAVWPGWQSGGGLLASAPAVIDDGFAVDVFVQGIDNAPYWQRFVPDTGFGWQPMGGGRLSAPPAVAANASGITAFVRGADAQVYTERFVGGWPGWTSIGGVPFSSAPIALAGPRIDAAPAPPGAGLGFDTCEAPALGTMQAWRLASPYTSAGIYIGGENRACRNFALDNPTWVNSVVAQGWRLIPIYVGLQAPCINFSSSRMSSDPDAAFWQGAVAANTATTNATAAGLPRGSPIYLDMEGYDNSTFACAMPVWGFVSGWVAALHSNGWVAGLYSSLCSGIKDQALLYDNPAYNRVDAIWVAAWNGIPNTLGFTGPCAISDSLWPYHQRLHQYTGGHNETWAGRTLNIDNNAVDGPLAPP